MKTDCSLNYKFNTWKFQAQTWREHVVYRNCFWHSEQFLYTTCSPHVVQKEELLRKINLYINKLKKKSVKSHRVKSDANQEKAGTQVIFWNNVHLFPKTRLQIISRTLAAPNYHQLTTNIDKWAFHPIFCNYVFGCFWWRSYQNIA